MSAITRSAELVAETRLALGRLIEDLASEGTSPLALVAACRQMSDCLEACFARAVTEARSYGFTWEAVARGIPGFEHGAQADALGLFEMVASDGVLEPAVYWWWLHCGALVEDLGPFEAHPADLQQGHVGACPRLLGEVAAYLVRRAQTGPPPPTRGASP